MPDVTVPDVAVAITTGPVGVNRNRSVTVPAVAASVDVQSPTLYTETPAVASKAAIKLARIPVQDGYQVTPIADFSMSRHDGGISLAREHRQHSQPMWQVRAKFIFTSEAEYSYIMPYLMSGVPFETDLVVNTTHAMDDRHPGIPYTCWPVPSSISLIGVSYAGYEVTLEFIATEV